MRIWFYFALTVIFSSTVSATELVHRAINPNFGGNVLNGSYLMSQASAQDNNKEPPVVEAPVNALQDFTDRLKESLLSEVANNASQKLFDANGNLVPGRTVTIGGFSVAISSGVGSDALNINITDGISSTQLTVPRATSSTTAP